MATKIPYNLIHKIEVQYGSVINAPADDPNLLELHRKLDIDEKPKTPNSIIEKRIIQMINKGWSVTEICSQLNLSFEKVTTIRIKNSLTYKPKFKYCVSKKGKRNLYIKALSNLTLETGIPYSYSSKTRSQLKDLGYNLKKGKYHWFDLDIGDRYIDTSNSFRILVKQAASL